MTRLAILAGGALTFALLAVLNAGGYRYGVSDQAFYIPIVLQQLAPDLFPFDGALIAAQDRFFLFDDWFAPFLATSGISVEAGFFGAYALTLTLMFGALVCLGRTMYASWWTVAGLLTALTIRHRIPDTAVNTLEAYFHPRLLAFTIGLWAVATFLRGRTWTAFAVTVVALLAHPTTGLWFAIWLGSAALVSDHANRTRLIAVAGGAAGVAIWTLMGPLRDQMVIMDPTWSAVLEIKDYLIVTNWPALTWVGNLAIAALIGAVYRYRRSLGLTTPRESGLVAGCAVLLGLFLCSIPLAVARVAFVVQLQTSRIFWILDVFGTCYLIWLLVESPKWSRPRVSWLQVSPRPVLVGVLVLLTCVRGGYVAFIEQADRPVVQTDLESSDWNDVMSWASRQPVGTHFLAHPGHAYRYGTSVRAASGRDVYLEIVKDTGIAIYSSHVAHRISERMAGLGDFETLDARRARALAARYELDFLITESDLDLPEARRTGRFRVYDLTGDDPVLAAASTAQVSRLQDD